MDNTSEDDGQRLIISPTLMVTVRPLVAEDWDELIELFNHLSPTSRYNRFHTVLTQPTDEFVLRWAKQLANVPPEEGEAWVVIADLPGSPETVIGGGRYVFVEGMGRKTAEISIAIRDEMQRQGIGTKLLQFIARAAQKNGVERLRATVLRENRGGIGIVERLPYPSVFRPVGDEFEVEIDLETDQQAKK